MNSVSKQKTACNKFFPLLTAFALSVFGAHGTLAKETTAASDQISVSAFRAPGEKASVIKTMRKPSAELANSKARDTSKKQGIAKPDSPRRESYSGEVWFHSAAVSLSSDYDADGYYTRLSVDFDLDTDYLVTDVYARLFLSLEQGPWVEYAVTDDFLLTAETGEDSYYVDTDLVEGFLPGYYDLKIEVYASDDDYFLASYEPADSADFSFLPLEDELADSDYIEAVDTVVTVSSGGGGGSLNIMTLSMLLLLAMVKSIRRDKRVQ